MTTYKIEILVEGKDNASGMLGGVGGALQRMGEIAGGILGAQLFMKLADGIMSMASNAISATANMQALQVGLEGLLAREISNTGGFDKLGNKIVTVSAAMPIAQEKAKALMEELSKIAVLSPYQVSDVQNTFKMAMAFGYTAEEAKKFTAAILDVAAGVGADNSMLDRMAYNFAQIRLVGKVTQMDVRQLAMAGFDLNSVLKYTGKQFGVTVNEIGDFNDAIASGKITWAGFANSFQKYAKENFGGAADRMSRTLVGLKSTFADVFTLTMPKLLGPAAEVFTGFANEVLNGFLSIRDSGVLEAAGAKLGDWAKKAVADVKKFGQDAGKVLQNFQTKGLIGGAKDLLSQILPPAAAMEAGRILDQFQIGLDNFGQFWQTYGPGIKTAIGGIIDKLLEFGGTALKQGIDWISQAWVGVSTWFTEHGPLIQGALSGIKTAIESVGKAANDAWTIWLKPTFDKIGELFGGVATGILKIANGDLHGAMQEFAAVIGRFFTEVIPTFFTGLAEWICKTFLGTTWNDVLKNWADNWEKLKTIVAPIIEDIKAALGPLIEKIGTAIAKIRELNDIGGKIPGTNLYKPGVNPDPFVKTKRAGGGPVWGGVPAIVGEQGIELFVPQQNGRIYSNRELARLVQAASSGTGNTFNFYLTPKNSVDISRIPKLVFEEAEKRSS